MDIYKLQVYQWLELAEVSDLYPIWGHGFTPLSPYFLLQNRSKNSMALNSQTDKSFVNLTVKEWKFLGVQRSI